MNKLALIILGFVVLACQRQRVSQHQSQTGSCQLVVVLSPSDTSTQAQLQRYEKRNGGKWQPVGLVVAVTVGRSGLAWGRGLHRPHMGQQKREGDGKSPSGIYAFGKIFGYAPVSEVNFKMPYIQAEDALECVDDVKSKFYNQLVDNRLTPKDWGSSEFMHRPDHQYRWGVTVDHNTSPIQPAGGSCIFFHIWRQPGAPTSGCTAMTEENLLELLHWLDAKDSPILLQVTRAEYPAFKQQLGLP